MIKMMIVGVACHWSGCPPAWYIEGAAADDHDGDDDADDDDNDDHDSESKEKYSTEYIFHNYCFQYLWNRQQNDNKVWW